jgi:hypothetical protein
MRVLQLGPFPPPNGGVQTNLKAIHDLLGERGHTMRSDRHHATSQTEGVPNVYKPSTVFELLKLLLTLRFDIVHFHVGGDLNFRLATLMLVCGLLPNRKSVVTFHSGGTRRKPFISPRLFSWRGFAFRSLILSSASTRRCWKCSAFRRERTKNALDFAVCFTKTETEFGNSREIDGFAEKHQPFLLPSVCSKRNTRFLCKSKRWN